MLSVLRALILFVALPLQCTAFKFWCVVHRLPALIPVPFVKYLILVLEEKCALEVPPRKIIYFSKAMVYKLFVESLERVERV